MISLLLASLALPGALGVAPAAAMSDDDDDAALLRQGLDSLCTALFPPVADGSHGRAPVEARCGRAVPGSPTTTVASLCPAACAPRPAAPSTTQSLRFDLAANPADWHFSGGNWSEVGAGTITQTSAITEFGNLMVNTKAAFSSFNVSYDFREQTHSGEPCDALCSCHVVQQRAQVKSARASNPIKRVGHHRGRLRTGLGGPDPTAPPGSKTAQPYSGAECWSSPGFVFGATDSATWHVLDFPTQVGAAGRLHTPSSAGSGRFSFLGRCRASLCRLQARQSALALALALFVARASERAAGLSVAGSAEPWRALLGGRLDGDRTWLAREPRRHRAHPRCAQPQPRHQIGLPTRVPTMPDEQDPCAVVQPSQQADAVACAQV